MKRFIAVGIMVLAMSAWWAVPAVAGCNSDHAVIAPNNGSHGSNGHAPSPEQKACVPGNDGTDTAADNTQSAIDGSCD
jgi:hypothetical protein